MNLDLVVPISFTFSLIAYVLIAKWYLWPWLVSVSKKQAYTPLLIFHSFRHIGLAFLIPGITYRALDPGFSIPAAYGDLLAAILAFVALIAVRLDRKSSTILIWIFNIIGALDLINALFQGLQKIPAGHLGSTHFIPAVIVPALLVTHYLIFQLLIKTPANKSH
jgi:hypothetical protein